MTNRQRLALLLACLLLVVVAYFEGCAQGQRQVMREAYDRQHAVKWYASEYAEPLIIWQDDERLKWSGTSHSRRP